MASTKKVFDPKAGRVETIKSTDEVRAREATGAYGISEQEAVANDQAVARRARESSLVNMQAADAVAKARGLGESVGVPVDKLATDLGGHAAREYLGQLKEDHPLVSAVGEMSGQVMGGLATGGIAAEAPAAGSGLVRKLAGSAFRGGVENLIMGSTSDLNEKALGDPDATAEKLLANLPKHAAIGAVGGVAGHLVGDAIGGIFRKGTAATESGLRKGADALVPGDLRAAIGTDVPKDVVGALEARQAVFRAQSEAAAVGAQDSLLGRQQGEAFGLAARQERDALNQARATRGKVDLITKANQEAEAKLVGGQKDALGSIESKTAEAKKSTFDRGVVGGEELKTDQEWARIAHKKANDDAIKELVEQHQMARDALDSQTKEAVSRAEELSKDADKLRKQVRGLADHLDQVRGAERPQARNILDAANLEFHGPAPREQVPSAIDFSAEEKAAYAREHGVNPVRREQSVPMSDIEHQPVWEPAKMEALRAQAEAGQGMAPVRLTKGESGKWVIEDGIHRTNMMKDAGASHINAITTEHLPLESSLTPASENAQRVFGDWTNTFAEQSKNGLSFRQLQDAVESLETIERRTRVVSGTGVDPDVSRAIQSIRDAAEAEFTRASEATAGSISEARNLTAARSSELYAQAKAARDGALDAAEKLTDGRNAFEKQANKELSKADVAARSSAEELERTLVSERAKHAENAAKQVAGVVKAGDAEAAAAEKAHVKELHGQQLKGQSEIKDAERAADREASSLESRQKHDRASLIARQKEEGRAIPKASKDTPYDDLLKKYTPKEGEGPTAMSRALGIGSAMLSLLHGNAASAAMSIVGSMGGASTKASKNLAASRALRGLADHLAGVDKEIFNVGGRAVGRYVRQAGNLDVKDTGPKGVTFSDASDQVYNAQANPAIIEAKVRQSMGHWANEAPEVYSAILQASQRQSAFLSSKLPPTRSDPHSLTPGLDHDEPSDSEKYEFLQYFRAANDPIRAMRDVVAGHGDELQVEAVRQCYPKLYEQTKQEVMRQLNTLTKPLTYEQEVSIGTLLDAETNDVLTGDFQSSQSEMYNTRKEQEKIDTGSKPPGPNSKLSHSMQSEGQSIQENP